MDIGIGPYELVIIGVLAAIFVAARDVQRGSDALADVVMERAVKKGKAAR